MKIPYIIILGIFAGIMIVIYWLSTITEGEYYRRHSPDGQYSVYASRNKYFNLNLPFVKFNDAGGKIHLYDELENKLVGSSSIGMISDINELFWNEEEVYSKASINIKLPRKIDTKIINDSEKSVPEKHTWILSLHGNHYTINRNHNRLTVSNKKGEILLQNIQHISQINNGFQVLNDVTEIEYYDAELNKLKNAPETKIKYLDVCGNVATYSLKIEKNDKYYFIKKAIGFTNYSFDNYTVIDSISQTKVKDIYFVNKNHELTHDENILKQEIVIINFETYFGIWSEKHGIEYFDAIDLKSTPIKVMRNNLYGYYSITPTTYLKLDSFEYNLARFEKNDSYGKKRNGYVDSKGDYFYQYK